MRIAKLSSLLFLLPLLLTACSDSPEQSADAVQDALTADESILRFVPADTPYVVAAAEPMPDEIKDKFAPQTEAVLESYTTLLKAVINQEPEDPSADQMDEETRKRLTAMVDELAGMITPDGMPAAGIDRDSTMAVYGVGLLPVMRVTLSDGALFEQAISKMEAKAGEKLGVAEVDGVPYRYAGDDKFRLIIAVIDDQLVMSLVPSALQSEPLKAVLGITSPGTSIAESGGLAALAEKYGYQSYWLGYVDFERIVSTFLDDQSSVNGAVLAMADYDASKLTDVCKAEIRSMTTVVPRFVTGYTAVSTEELSANSVFEVRSDIAAGLQTLTAPVPGLGANQGGLISFGMSLDMLAAREFYSARLDALEADPYQCELFADLQGGVAKGREMLNKPLPPIVYGFQGFLAVIDDIQGMDIQNKKPPTEIDMRFLVATDNAEGLLAMGAMFSPEIASLNLQPNSKSVKLEVPALAATVDTAYVAMSENALALSVGAGSETGLEEMLAATAPQPSPFMSMGMDAERYYAMVGDALQHGDSGNQSTEITEATRAMMEAAEKMFSRITFDVQFTERGVEIPTTMVLAD